ncbi:uncharacterized protein BJ212DRAFT_1297394 [Suillus subaureus]|uniref:Uncharacterized protein n=1 Tax=Suillus subaureus TaxID=48587 RepID=A0A9P7EGC8_9AGAM|nr:uncharacterized protein BJ212DRAFT_1297394 [Suillus subaureus]KAG1820908.1 hypothetical protein BJ212DRAFT_1297394 [Suillus subaureus]
MTFSSVPLFNFLLCPCMQVMCSSRIQLVVQAPVAHGWKGHVREHPVGQPWMSGGLGGALQIHSPHYQACGRRDPHMGEEMRVPAVSKDDGSIFGGTLGIVGDLLEEGMVARILGYHSSLGKNLKKLHCGCWWRDVNMIVSETARPQMAPGIFGSCKAAANNILSMGTVGNVKGSGTNS